MGNFAHKSQKWAIYNPMFGKKVLVACFYMFVPFLSSIGANVG